MLSLLCCASAAAAPTAVVAVDRAGTCPGAETLSGAMRMHLDVVGRPAATVGRDGEFLLSVIERSDQLGIELRSGAGRPLMVRELDGRGTSCAGRARSIAVIVQRFLEALPVPPAGLRTRAILPKPPETYARIEPRAGFSVDAAFGADVAVGAALGATVRPARWLSTHLVGRLHAPQHEPAGAGEVSVSRHSVALAASLTYRRGAIRGEGGVGGRADFVSVTVQGQDGRRQASQVNPAGLLLLGGSIALYGPLVAFTTIEFYVHTTTQIFEVEGVGEVARTSRYGVAAAVGLGYGVLAR